MHSGFSIIFCFMNKWGDTTLEVHTDNLHAYVLLAVGKPACLPQFPHSPSPDFQHGKPSRSGKRKEYRDDGAHEAPVFAWIFGSHLKMSGRDNFKETILKKCRALNLVINIKSLKGKNFFFLCSFLAKYYSWGMWEAFHRIYLWLMTMLSSRKFRTYVEWV